jgi:hypothetical protein
MDSTYCKRDHDFPSSESATSLLGAQAHDGLGELRTSWSLHLRHPAALGARLATSLPSGGRVAGVVTIALAPVARNRRDRGGWPPATGRRRCVSAPLASVEELEAAIARAPTSALYGQHSRRCAVRLTCMQARRLVCELVVRDAYHRVIDHEVIDRAAAAADLRAVTQRAASVLGDREALHPTRPTQATRAAGPVRRGRCAARAAA